MSTNAATLKSAEAVGIPSVSNATGLASVRSGRPYAEQFPLVTGHFKQGSCMGFGALLRRNADFPAAVSLYARPTLYIYSRHGAVTSATQPELIAPCDDWQAMLTSGSESNAGYSQ